MKRMALLLALGVAACTQAHSTFVPAAPAQLHGLVPASALNGIKVSGNKLVDGNGNPVQLHGVNRSGTEYACIQGWGIFDGPSDATSIAAMTAWNVNAVRVPLNEDCWLAINGVKAQYAGNNYRNAILKYVALLHQAGMYAEISLIWGAPGSYKATYQPGGPDQDHSPAMWASMAAAFKNDPNVILAPWGETITGWKCFMQTGCNNQATYGPKNQGYQTASMKEAISAMRGAGYNGPISLPCIDYANMCGKLPAGSEYNGSTWLKSRPADPKNQTIAEAHVYGNNACDTAACFNSSMAPIAKVVPLIFGETGEDYAGKDCSAAFISTFLPWADAHGVGYEAWAWDDWSQYNYCSVLIKDYSGTPSSAWATYVKSHYLSL